jgi:retron-type reverse transcriptase
LIEGDISQYFDDIDHHILINIITQDIRDQSFIDLLWKTLRVGYGYTTDHIENRNLGTPQGGVVSHILANIYFNKLDIFMKSVKSTFDFGKRKKCNPEYTKMIRNNKLNINPLNPKDFNFKRLNYVRYADDFITGVIGSYADCLGVRDKIKEFFKTKFKLTLNLEKTRITNARRNSALFLGYKINIGKKRSDIIKYVVRCGPKKLTRVASRPIINGPIDLIVRKLILKGFAKAGKIVKPTRQKK